MFGSKRKTKITVTAKKQQRHCIIININDCKVEPYTLTYCKSVATKCLKHVVIWFLKFVETLNSIVLVLKIIVKPAFAWIIKTKSERNIKISHTNLLVLQTSYNAWTLDNRKISSANHAISDSFIIESITLTVVCYFYVRLI